MTAGGNSWRWLALLFASLALTALFEQATVPAALLLGPMFAGIAFGLGGVRLRVPTPVFAAAQALLGCVVAHTLSAGILGTIQHGGAAIALAVALTILAGGVVGYVMVRFGSLPGVTAAWGSAPGAASMMVALAGEFGADTQLVAFMQYLRMIIVVLSASTVPRLILDVAPVPVSAPVAGPWLGGNLTNIALTLLLAAAGGALGRLSRLPGGSLLVPMVAGAVLQSGGWLAIELPPWLLGAVYLSLGWFVGLGFTRPVFLHAVRAIPQIALASLMLIGLCAASAWVLTRWLGIDALSAFLATSPGGFDTVVVIAIATHADMSMVMATQTLRLFAVIATGPAIARWICRHA